MPKNLFVGIRNERQLGLRIIKRYLEIDSKFSLRDKSSSCSCIVINILYITDFFALLQR